MSPFVKALIWTAAPLGGLSLLQLVASIITVAFGLNLGALSLFGSILMVVLFGVAAAIVAAIVFAILRKKQLAAGTLVGAAIGLVTMAASCFAELFLTLSRGI